MKSAISRVLIAASLLMALGLGVLLFRTVVSLANVAYNDDTFVQASPSGLLRPMFVSLSPPGLYAASFALDRRTGWSGFGKLGFAVQVAYGLLLVGGSIYVHHLARTI